MYSLNIYIPQRLSSLWINSWIYLIQSPGRQRQIKRITHKPTKACLHTPIIPGQMHSGKGASGSPASKSDTRPSRQSRVRNHASWCCCRERATCEPSPSRDTWRSGSNSLAVAHLTEGWRNAPPSPSHPCPTPWPAAFLVNQALRFWCLWKEECWGV